MLNLGSFPGGTPVLYSTSPGEQALHIVAEARVPCRDSEGRRERKVWFILPLAPRGADWVRLDAPPPLGPNAPPGSTRQPPPDFDAALLTEAEQSLGIVGPRLCAHRAFSNRHATLVSEAGEDREAFIRRCAEALEGRRREEGEKFRKMFEQKIERIRELQGRDLRGGRAESEEERLQDQERSINVMEARLEARFGGRRPAVPNRGAAGERDRSEIPEPPLQASGQKIGLLGEQLRDLQAEMDAQARRIEQKYADMASTVVEETLIPERRDFRIEQLSLVWIGANEVH